MEHLFHNASRETSNAAYESVKPNLGTIKYRIASTVRETGSMTDDEIEVALDLSHQTASAARRALVKDGVLEATGDKRPTRSGRLAQTWRVVR
jgi:predicted HTH transcriptional regulator